MSGPVASRPPGYCWLCAGFGTTDVQAGPVSVPGSRALEAIAPYTD